MGALSLCLRIGVCAGEAAFADDGNNVYFEDTKLKSNAPLCSLSVKTGQIASAPFKFSTPNETFRGICSYTEKSFLIVSEQHLWKWDPDSLKTTMLETAPTGCRFDDVAYSVRSGRILITQSPTGGEPQAGCYCYIKERETSPLVAVRAARLSYLLAPQFLDDDSLVFGCDGDLWHGRVQLEPHDPSEPKDTYRFLAAYRYAPLGTPENYMSTPSATGVKALAVSHGMLYAQVSRLAGDGWGALIRLPLPPTNKEDFDRHDDFRERRKIYLEALQQVELLDHESDWPALLCVRADGNVVHFVGSTQMPPLQPRHYLIDNNGKPKQVGP